MARNEARGRNSALESLASLDSAKRRAYMVGLSLAIPMDTIGFELSARGEIHPLVTVNQYGSAVLYALMLVLLVKLRRPLATFEGILYGVLAPVYILRVSTVMFTYEPLEHEVIGLFSSFTGSVVLYVLAFVAFDKARARLITIAMLVAATVVSVWAMAGKLSPGAEEFMGALPWLVGIHLIIIVLLYVLADAKERLAYSLAMAEAMAGIAATDPLTGVANRRELSSVVDDLIDQRRRYGTPLSLVLIDVDHFKQVNDRLGHAVGDEVLREVCDRFQGALRSTDTLGRWGGEEFLVVAPSTELDEAVRLAERCACALRARPIGSAGIITASFGVATHIGHEDVDQLLRRTDEALFHAKDQGRNRVAAAPDLDGLGHLAH